jgi:16S rRNA C967 or C1407 C5-methylase (RsmB/RsmF family)
VFSIDGVLDNVVVFSEYQRKLFDAGVDMLKPGGILIYSTCTISPAENEGIVAYALDKHKDTLRLIEPSHTTQSSRSLEVFGLGFKEASYARRFWPSGGPEDTVAFFYAKFLKI